MFKLSANRITALLLAGVLLTSAAGCGNGTAEPPESSAEPTTTTTTTAPAPKLGLNMFTGENDMATDNNRPIGFVVPDESSTLAQLNIESADMYFESETEAGIPRMLVLYSSIDRIPDAIGPIRSARPHFVKMAKALDAIYCHIGGSNTGLNTIKELGVNDIGSDASVIDTRLKNSSNVSWNRSAFVQSKVLNIISSKKLKTTTSTTSPFRFGEKSGTGAGNTLVVQISSNYDMAFTYDASTGLYAKHRNSLSTPVHKTLTGGTINVSNVVVMYDHRTVDETYENSSGGTTVRYNYDLNSGSGLLVSGGTSRSIKWTRSNSRLSYYESDGTTPLTVAQGKTFICLVNQDIKNQTTVQ